MHKAEAGHRPGVVGFLQLAGILKKTTICKFCWLHIAYRKSHPNSPGLMNFAVWLVDSVYHNPNRHVNFLKQTVKEIQITARDDDLFGS